MSNKKSTQSQPKQPKKSEKQQKKLTMKSQTFKSSLRSASLIFLLLTLQSTLCQLPCNKWPNCTQCSYDMRICSQCEPSFYLDHTNTCIPCMSGCLICYKEQSCEECHNFFQRVKVPARDGTENNFVCVGNYLKLLPGLILACILLLMLLACCSVIYLRVRNNQLKIRLGNEVEKLMEAEEREFEMEGQDYSFGGEEEPDSRLMGDVSDLSLMGNTITQSHVE